MGKLEKIKLLATDVDGVLTNGDMIYTDTGQTKVFNVRDGLATRLALISGLRIAWITGNVTPVVAARAKDLGIEDIYQGARYKTVALNELMNRYGLSADEVAFIGDDLNDLPAFETAGVSVAVNDAAPEVKEAADIVTERPGGSGALREVIELILKSQGKWQEACRAFLDELRVEQDQGRVSQVVG